MEVRVFEARVEVFLQEFIRKFLRCQRICSKEGDIRVIEVRVMETLLYILRNG